MNFIQFYFYIAVTMPKNIKSRTRKEEFSILTGYYNVVPSEAVYKGSHPPNMKGGYHLV
jgi:hypothetical protein